MSFLDNIGVWIYFIIFFGKILEVTVSTLRMVLINRGERIKGAILAFFDVLLWLVITGSVLSGYQEDPIRIVVFALAFAVGNYLGSYFDEKLAFGLSSIEVIIDESEKALRLATLLRDSDFAVTVLRGSGRDGQREVLLMHVKRKNIKRVHSLIKQIDSKACIVVRDAKAVTGGYLSRK